MELSYESVLAELMKALKEGKHGVRPPDITKWTLYRRISGEIAKSMGFEVKKEEKLEKSDTKEIHWAASLHHARHYAKHAIAADHKTDKEEKHKHQVYALAHVRRGSAHSKLSGDEYGFRNASHEAYREMQHDPSLKEHPAKFHDHEADKHLNLKKTDEMLEDVISKSELIETAEEMKKSEGK